MGGALQLVLSSYDLWFCALYTLSMMCFQGHLVSAGQLAGWRIHKILVF
jgi:hypothetical protein